MQWIKYMMYAVDKVYVVSTLIKYMLYAVDKVYVVCSG